MARRFPRDLAFATPGEFRRLVSGRLRIKAGLRWDCGLSGGGRHLSDLTATRYAGGSVRRYGLVRLNRGQ